MLFNYCNIFACKMIQQLIYNAWKCSLDSANDRLHLSGSVLKELLRSLCNKKYQYQKKKFQVKAKSDKCSKLVLVVRHAPCD